MAFQWSGVVQAAPQVVIDWQAGKFRDAVRKEMMRRIDVCLEIVKQRIISRSSTPTFSAGPSQPGDYPHQVTGAFINSLQKNLDESTLSGSLTSTAPHAVFLELGTNDAGVVFPIRKKALSWVSYPSGVRHTVPYIVHKGIKPRPAFQKAFAECAGRIRAVMETYLPL